MWLKPLCMQSLSGSAVFLANEEYRMASIAYVDHSYHAKTGSNSFLVDLLRTHGHAVTLFWDESWRGEETVSFDLVKNFDVVIMFQAKCAKGFLPYRKIHQNVIQIPMLDQFSPHCTAVDGLETYLNTFRGCKLISFSSALHCAAKALGATSLRVKYYPVPEGEAPSAGGGLRAFFWIRHEDLVSWPMVRALMGNTVFANLHLHIAPDPYSPPLTLPTDEEIKKYNITTSAWFEKKEDFLRVLRRANVFFAPRMAEGIGQSFLEAMGRGQCVVAPDNGTMNEYIVHGVNGLLYDPLRIEPLDFSNVATLGKNAHESVRAGRVRWEGAAESLVAYILTPHAAFPHRKWASTLVSWLRGLDIRAINKLLDMLRILYKKKYS